MKPAIKISPFRLLIKQPFLLIAACVGSVVTSSQASLVAWYTFDEGAGATTAVNSVLGGTDGVIGSGITTGAAGVSGSAYYFTGLNGNQTNCVDMGNASFLSDFTSSGQLSYSAWVKTTDTTGNRNTVVFAGDDTGSQNYTDMGVAAAQTGHPGEASARNRPNLTTGVPEIFSTGIQVNDGKWHNIVMTVDLSTSLLSLYVDGGLVNSLTMSVAGDNFPNFDNFEIGRLGRSSPTDAYTGYIDDVQVYDSALSATDIQYIFNNPGVAAVPEPSTSALIGLSGVVALCGVFRKRQFCWAREGLCSKNQHVSFWKISR